MEYQRFWMRIENLERELRDARAEVERLTQQCINSHGTAIVLAKKLAAVAGRNWQEWHAEAEMERQAESEGNDG